MNNIIHYKMHDIITKLSFKKKVKKGSSIGALLEKILMYQIKK